MDTDGSGEVQLTHPSAVVIDSLPEWSPDRTQVAFQREYTNRPYEIRLVSADGTGEAEVDPGCPSGSSSKGSSCAESSPAWSPDGRRIAFTWAHGDVRDPTIEVNELAVMDADGDNAPELQRHIEAEDVTPTWSPDGRRIAFIRQNTTAAPAGATAVFVMNADGSHQEQITPWDLRAADPDWSPDGTLISFRSEPSGQDFVGNLHTVTPNGSRLRQLTDHDDGVTQVLGSSFSPNATWLVFSQTGDGGQPDLFLVRRHGTDLTQLTRTPSWESAPDWRP